MSPSIPQHISGCARHEWRRASARLGSRIDHTDSTLLELYCETYDRYRELVLQVRETQNSDTARELLQTRDQLIRLSEKLGLENLG